MKSIWPRILRFCFRFMKRKAMLFSIPSWRSFLGNMAFLVWMLQFSSYIWILIKPVSTFKSFGWLLHYVDILSSAIRSFVDERSVVIHICSREALNSWLARAAYSISPSFQTYLKNSSLYFREPAENELLVFYFFSIYCLFVRLCLCAWKTWTRTRSFVSWNNAKTRRLSKRIERWGPFDGQIQQHIDWPNSNFNHKVS